MGRAIIREESRKLTILETSARCHISTNTLKGLALTRNAVGLAKEPQSQAWAQCFGRQAGQSRANEALDGKAGVETLIARPGPNFEPFLTKSSECCVTGKIGRLQLGRPAALAQGGWSMRGRPII